MLPFGHLIFAWVIGLVIQSFSKIKISRLGWGLLFFGALIPDVDYLFSFIFGVNIHRMFFHSLLFVLILFFIVYIILKNLKLEREAYFVFIGVLSHIILDMFIFPGAMLFWPLGTWFSFYGIANVVSSFVLDFNFWRIYSFYVSFDILIGLIWLVYLYLKGKIQF
jgi:membrane-bound metal-dependent hydrolase YbcI (DUF457 family)